LLAFRGSGTDQDRPARPGCSLPHLTCLTTTPMFAFILSRILQAIPVLLVVASSPSRCSPNVGDPITIMLGQDYTEAQRQALIHQLGHGPAVFVQLRHFLWALPAR